MTCIDLHHFFFIAWRKEASPTRNRNIYNYCCMSISILHKLSLLFLLVLPPRSKSDRHRLSRKSAKKPENWEEKTAVQKREHAKNFAFGKGLFLTDIDRHSTSIKKIIPTQTAYAVYSAKEKAKSSVSDFKRGMVQEQQSRQTGQLEKQEQRRQNIADKRMELQKAQEARQAQRKADGSATTGATRPHERPATASKPSAEKMQEVKRPATATTSKASEPVKTNVIKERPLSSGASDRKATQPAQPVHRQNVEKVVSQETHQNDTKDRRIKVQQTQTVQKNQQTIEKTRNLVTKKGQKKK